MDPALRKRIAQARIQTIVMLRLLALVLAAGAVLGAEADPREIVRQSLARDEKNWKLLQNYVFRERVEKVELDKQGDEKSRDVKTFEVTPLEGSAYRRLVSRNGKPLSEEEEAAEQAKLEQSIQERRDETPKQREKRIRQYEKRRDRYRKAISEIPDAFNFRLLGEELVHSRPVYVIEAVPRPGYEPRNLNSRILTKMKGTLWVDKATYAWTRAEAELIEDFTIGWILVRVHKGTRAVVETFPLQDGAWGLRRLWYETSYRIGLIKYGHVRQENHYSDYRKFEADSRIVSVTPIPGEPAR